MKIINLTQHNATETQRKQGVIELDSERKQKLKKLLTFEEIPTSEEIQERARKIRNIVEEYIKENKISEDKVGFMIGGAPFLMSSLERELANMGKILYAFSQRKVIEKEVDGKVVKQSVFEHIGFVEPPRD